MPPACLRDSVPPPRKHPYQGLDVAEAEKVVHDHNDGFCGSFYAVHVEGQ